MNNKSVLILLPFYIPIYSSAFPVLLGIMSKYVHAVIAVTNQIESHTLSDS